MYVGLIRLTNVLIDGAITMAARHKGTVDEGGGAGTSPTVVYVSERIKERWGDIFHHHLQIQKLHERLKRSAAKRECVFVNPQIRRPGNATIARQKNANRALHLHLAV